MNERGVMASSTFRLTSFPWFKRSARFQMGFRLVYLQLIGFVMIDHPGCRWLFGLATAFVIACTLVRSGVEVDGSGAVTRWWGLLFPWVRWDQTGAGGRLLLARRSSGPALSRVRFIPIPDVFWVVLSFGSRNVALFGAATPTEAREVGEEIARRTGLQLVDVL